MHAFGELNSHTSKFSLNMFLNLLDETCSAFGWGSNCEIVDLSARKDFDAIYLVCPSLQLRVEIL